MNMYFVTILWGENPSKHEEPELYYFNTEREREAFMSGVNTAMGWQDYDVQFHSTAKKFKHEEFDNYKGEDDE